MTQDKPASGPEGTDSSAASSRADAAAARAREGQPSPPRPSVSEPRKGQVISKKYRLDRLIARGGMGAVWAGQDLALERPVAIKFMDPAIAASDGLRSRFNREAKAAAQLRTPYVVQIHEHGVHLGLPYIVMELLEGEDLHARLRRERRLPLKTAARILTQAAKALKKAHAIGIVHRDLKPQNIFLADQDEEMVVKILDFGIAKRMAGDTPGDTTKTGQVLGSPHYMSPEQARGLKNIDHRSDLWSLAVILYRTITGRKAFTGEATGDVIVHICTQPLPVPSERAPDLPKSVDEFFERALARNPDNRFQSAMDLAQAFADIAQAASDVALFTPPPDSEDEAGDMALTTPISDAGLASPAALGAPDSARSPAPLGASGPISTTDPSADRAQAAVPPAGATPVEPTPAPMSGPTGPSLATPSVVDLPEIPFKRRKWLPWALGAAALAGGGVLAIAFVDPADSSPESESAPAAAAEQPPTSAPEEPALEEPAPPAEPTTEGLDPSAQPSTRAAPSSTATASAAATTMPLAKTQPRPSPPRPRPPPRPAPTPTKTKPKWGY